MLLLLLVPPVAGQPAVATLAPAAGQGSFLRAEDHRIASIAYRIATKGARLCAVNVSVTGLSLHQLGEYAPADRLAAIERFGVDRGPGVLSVVAGSPAERSGLVAGDVLIAVDGMTFPSGVEIAAELDAKLRRTRMEGVEAQLDERLKSGPVRLDVWREGRTRSILLDREMGCPGKARLARSEQANAFATGTYAIMTSKMLAFFKNDDELAVAMAHEMAHNILGHPARLDEQGVPRGILRGIGKNAGRVLETEVEADRLGTKLVWASGFDVNAAIPFWRRLYARYDPIPVPKFLRTHPSLGARERMIEQVLSEIRETQPIG